MAITYAVASVAAALQDADFNALQNPGRSASVRGFRRFGAVHVRFYNCNCPVR
jgi:hypothetical protein